MKNKVSLLTIAISTMLSGCIVMDNGSNIGMKKQNTQDKMQKEFKKLQENNNKLKQEKEQLKTENNNLKDEKGQLQADNDRLKEEKERLEEEKKKLEEEQKKLEILETGDWKIIDSNGIDIEKTEDAVGFIYKFDGKEIKNGKISTKHIIINKEITLTDNFEKLFENLIDNINQPNESLNDTEIDKVIGALTKFKEGKAISELEPEQQEIIKKLDGCSAGGAIKYEDVFGNNEAKKKLYDLILSYLDAKNIDAIKKIDMAEKKLKYEYKEINTLKQGRKNVGLKYTDFGSWTKSFDVSNLSEDLKKYLGNNLDTQETIKYFATGADNYKVDFNIDNEKDLTFTGKTIGSVSKDSKIKHLDGTATLSVNKGQSTGKLDLNFDNWYKFSLDKLKLDDFTEDAGATWTVDKVDGTSIDEDFKFHNDATSKSVENATIKGGFYGENHKAEEVVGTYTFKTKDDKGTEFDVNGAFGAKK